MIDVHYIAITNSDDGEIKIGTPVYIQRHTVSGDLKFALFGICRVGCTHKKEQKNDVRHLNAAELRQALKGVTVILDQKHARDRIDTLTQEVKELVKTYELKH